MKNFKHEKLFTTNNYTEITEVCKYALKRSLVIGISGYTGAGKTTTLKDYVNKNESVIYIVREKSMKTTDFYKHLLGIINPNANFKVNIYHTMRQIINIINSNEGNCLLIIDESGKCQPSDLEFLHELRENTLDKLGIILSGPPSYFANIEEWKRRNVRGVAEFERRIFGIKELKRPTLGEVKFICNNYEIEDDKIIKKWYKNIDNFGRLIDLITMYWDNTNGVSPIIS